MPKGLSEVAFFGRITAGFTHEMKNVLAVIKESAGLMQDLISMGQSEAFPHRDRFLRTLESMQTQVRRGVDLSSHLNRFAHSADEPEASVDLSEILAQLVLLAQRFARLKGVMLTGPSEASGIHMTTSPMQLQMALFACLECSWEAMPSEGEITLQVVREGERARIAFSCRGELGEPREFERKVTESPGWSSALESVGSLGGEVEWDTSSSSLLVTLPLRRG